MNSISVKEKELSQLLEVIRIRIIEKYKLPSNCELVIRLSDDKQIINAYKKK
jgi:hypothetical protein